MSNASIQAAQRPACAVGAVREAKQVDQAGAGHDALGVDAAVDARELGDERHLTRGARREVGVTALGRGGHEPAVDVVQQRFAEPGAGGDERRVAGLERHAFLEHRELVRLEHRHRVGHRLEVVEHRHGRLDPLRQRRAVDDPRHVGEPRDQARDRAGGAHAAGGHRRFAPVVEEQLDDLPQAGEVEGRVLTDRDRGRAVAAVVAEQTQVRLRASNVAGEQHAAIVASASERGP
jgi:hypothetical protein